MAIGPSPREALLRALNRLSRPAGRRPVTPCVGIFAVVVVVAGCSPVARGELEPPVRPVSTTPGDEGTTGREDRGGPPGSEGAARSPGLPLPDVGDTDLSIEPIEDPFHDEILESPVRHTPEMRERIDYWIRFWTERSRDNFQRYLDRMGMWQPLVDREIEARELPWSLRYVPIVESGYNPVAVSRASAVGMWQFMRGTARWKGMRVEGLVDERRDPIAATPKALDYLVELHEDLDSWFLALAAYNVGPGRIRTAIRRHAPPGLQGDSLFIVVADHLPSETRHHVPRFFAAAEIARDPVAYGFTPPNPADSLTFTEVTVPNATSLDVVAEAAGAELDDVVALNPMLVQRVTPINSPWTVRVPAGTGVQFAERLAEVPPEDRVTFIQHRVARGETLGHISEQYGVRLSALTAANPGVNPRRLQIGQRLIVPRGASAAAGRFAAQRAAAVATGGDSDQNAEAADAIATGTAITHIVQRGESPWTIARRYGVSVAQVLEWNGLDNGSTVFPGNRLAIREARVLVYRVQPGDTLSDIALKHGVSTRNLAEWNGLSLRSVIRPGQEMKIPLGS
jgi:membrane-bound lytic murein transglycosylase D